MPPFLEKFSTSFLSSYMSTVRPSMTKASSFLPVGCTTKQPMLEITYPVVSTDSKRDSPFG